MSLFEYGLKKSFEELEQSLHRVKDSLNDTVLLFDLNYRLGCCLHCIIDYWERVEKNAIPDEIRAYFSALRYANNQLKHEMTLTKLYQRTGGISFPIHFPLKIPEICFVWSLSSNKQTRNINQLKNYRKYLENKDVIKTIKCALDFLERYKLS